ncbi:unnamed protein product, partial [Effrenium voratum]
FGAFESKWNCLKDRWFIFDTLLAMALGELWRHVCSFTQWACRAGPAPGPLHLSGAMGETSSSCCAADTPPPAETQQVSTAEDDMDPFGPISPNDELGLSSGISRSLDYERSCKLQRLATSSHLQVDEEILRGIPLKETLRFAGKVWRTRPSKLSPVECEALWNRAQPTSSLDVFFSHTWMTAGWWKFMALSLQDSLMMCLLCWALAVGVAVTLCVFEILPLYETVSMENMMAQSTQYAHTPWTALFGLVGMMIGLLGKPYLPDFGRRVICFLDVACIHQGKGEFMERGIYGLGGVLKVSNELRVLWSKPYLSRLWCIFELAAYREANPTGRIVLVPLYVEITVVLTVLLVHATTLTFQAALLIASQLALATQLVPMLLMAVGCHFLRRSYLAKYKLASDLRCFQLSQAVCSSDFDREYVTSAICRWYGSPEAFTRYVQGPLRKELARSISDTQVRPGYLLLMALPMAGSAIDVALSRWKGNMPDLVPYIIYADFGATFLWTIVCLKVLLFVSYRFAAPWKEGAMDYAQSAFLCVIPCSIYALGTAMATWAMSLGQAASVIWLLLCASCAFLSLFCQGRCARRQELD